MNNWIYMRCLAFLITTFFILVAICQSRAQVPRKEVLTPAVFGRWNLPSQVGISEDGKYIYSIDGDLSVGRMVLMIQKVDGGRHAEYPCFTKPWFSRNSHNLVWMIAPDSLCIMNLSDFSTMSIPGIRNFWVSNDFLVYKAKMPENELTIINLTTGKGLFFSGIDQFQFSADGNHIILSRQLDVENQSLILIDLYNCKVLTIWEGSKLDFFIVNAIGSQVAFMVKDSIGIYSSHGRLKVVKFDSRANDFVIGKVIGFSKDGRCLFVTVIRKRTENPNLDKNGLVNIWRYSSRNVSPMRGLRNDDNDALAVVSLIDLQIHLLSNPGETVYFPGNEAMIDSVCLIHTPLDSITNFAEGDIRVWRLLYTYTGNRKVLDFTKNAAFVLMSTGGKYIVYYDKLQKDYFTYEIATGRLRNITNGMKVYWEKDPERLVYGYKYVCGWLKNDRALLIYSENDIWQIDPVGVQAPIKLTNGYGTKRNLKFFLAIDEYGYRFLENHDSLIVTAFNPQSKENGFYRITIGENRDPDSLTMGPYLFCISENPWVPSYFNFPPIKAARAERYIVRRMSAATAPNYYTTSDFKSFQQITNIAPQKDFNWYTSELHEWKSLDGSRLQGILYKPENFDASNKYPVIFYFYERMSDRLNAYIRPEALTGGSSINIPYYVSNGYIVFCPDMHYEIGDPLKGSYDAIISAAKYVSGLPYINSEKIGIQGSSWGAIQTNYLITHTDLFAAACSASGISNWVSGYGSLIADGVSAQEIYEKGQLRIGATLWEKAEVYIKNSSVLNVDKVTTPLLMMHTTNDVLCEFSNALEFFTALRRLGKRSWLLEYEGNHTLFGKGAEDFSIRMKQFFDHYLMDKPAPRWMTQALKASDAGLELDDSIGTPGKGLNMK